jgi:hypothetical protein
VDEILNGARDVITRGLDHLLHRGGFNRESAQGLIEAIPAELEQQLEEFVIDFCEQTGITVQEKDNNGGYFLALDRYFTLDSLPGVPIGSGYVGTFSREQALEREDFDFFATGHPMVEGIFSFLRDTPYGTATLRRYRKTGLRRCIGIQFNYRIESDARGDVDAPVFFPPRLITLAVDLQGTLRPDLVPLLTARYSKAYPMELEDIQEITRRQGWQEAAAAAAEQEARRLYREAAESAEKAFLEFANDEKRRLEAWFEHRLDTAEARAAFSKSASVVKAAQYEIRSIRREWARRQEELAERQEVFHRGQPILDSVALFVVS